MATTFLTNIILFAISNVVRIRQIAFGNSIRINTRYDLLCAQEYAHIQIRLTLPNAVRAFSAHVHANVIRLRRVTVHRMPSHEKLEIIIIRANVLNDTPSSNVN